MTELKHHKISSKTIFTILFFLSIGLITLFSVKRVLAKVKELENEYPTVIYVDSKEEVEEYINGK